MKQLFFLIGCVAAIVSQASQGGEFNAHCVQAAGYYANLSIKETKAGFRVVGSQGFGYPTTQKLGLTPAHTIVMDFSRRNCRLRVAEGGFEKLICVAPQQTVHAFVDWVKGVDYSVSATYVHVSISKQSEGNHSARMFISLGGKTSDIRKGFNTSKNADGCFFKSF